MPTEAEWEFATRAGTQTLYSFGTDARELGRYAWYESNSAGRTNPVGHREPNPWGLHDVHGNVWEWCADYYGAYTQRTAVDPKGPSAGSVRVVRGGSWRSSADECQSAFRTRGQDLQGGTVGFRVVVEPPETE